MPVATTESEPYPIYAVTELVANALPPDFSQINLATWSTKAAYKILSVFIHHSIFELK